MTPQEGSEYKATKARVEFGMGHAGYPDAILREELKKRMERSGREPFIPLLVSVKEFTGMLFANPDLNRIYSISLDGLECLPFRPDMAFDRWWAAFEVLLHKYASVAWNKDSRPVPTVDLFERVTNEVLMPELKDDVYLKLSVHRWCRNMPDSVARYGVARMILDREIKVASQFGNIKERALGIIGKDLFSAFEAAYIRKNNGIAELDGSNHYRAARKLKRMLSGDRLTFDGIEVKGIDLAHRVEFVMSCILYASRCERLHGDYFSPFFSDRAKISLYAHWYWLADTTYILFQVLFKRLIDYQGFSNPMNTRMLADYIKSLSKSYQYLFTSK